MPGDAVGGRLAPAGRAVGVVHRRRAVKANSDEGAVSRGRRTLVVSSVIGWILFWIVCQACDIAPSIQCATIEVDAHQRRLATLPGDGDLRRAVGLDQLAQVRLEHLIAHAEALAGIQ